MDTSRAPAFIFYLFKKKYIFIVDMYYRYLPSAPLCPLRCSRLSSQLLLLKSIFGQLFSKAIKRFNFITLNTYTFLLERGF
jgi:hypothetical protein